jgi:hypothetical protein
MAATALPIHIPTNSEASSHIVANVSQDGTITVVDAATGGRVQMRLAVISVGGQLTLVAVGPGSS